MDLLQSIHDLPKIEKIKIMEFIWEELTSKEGEFESPSWHEKALSDTEKRMKIGKEEIMDWDEAKKKLRKES
jgi:hypothetical protein